MNAQLGIDLYSNPALYEERLVYQAPQPDPLTPTLSIRRLGIVAMELKKTPFNSAARGLHVDERSAAVLDIKKRIEATLESFIWQGYRHFITSATQGVELWAAEAVLKLKDSYPGIALEIVVPYDKHSAKWIEELQERYGRVIAQADIVTTIHHDYTKGVIFSRNKYLLDMCHVLIGAFIPDQGSATEQLIRRAKWNGKQICQIPLVTSGKEAA